MAIGYEELMVESPAQLDKLAIFASCMSFRCSQGLLDRRALSLRRSPALPKRTGVGLEAAVEVEVVTGAYAEAYEASLVAEIQSSVVCSSWVIAACVPQSVSSKREVLLPPIASYQVAGVVLGATSAVSTAEVETPLAAADLNVSF